MSVSVSVVRRMACARRALQCCVRCSMLVACAACCIRIVVTVAGSRATAGAAAAGARPRALGAQAGAGALGLAHARRCRLPRPGLCRRLTQAQAHGRAAAAGGTAGILGVVLVVDLSSFKRKKPCVVFSRGACPPM
eukprot:scaffold11809_cov114-Isochrysis_galbana.AAC.1